MQICMASFLRNAIYMSRDDFSPILLDRWSLLESRSYSQRDGKYLEKVVGIQ